MSTLTATLTTPAVIRPAARRTTTDPSQAEVLAYYQDSLVQFLIQSAQDHCLADLSVVAHAPTAERLGECIAEALA